MPYSINKVKFHTLFTSKDFAFLPILRRKKVPPLSRSPVAFLMFFFSFLCRLHYKMTDMCVMC